MKLYQIIATVTRRSADGWKSTDHLPTFYLRDDIQGITSPEHAERIARRMVARLTEDSTVEHINISVSESAEFNPSLIGA